MTKLAICVYLLPVLILLITVSSLIKANKNVDEYYLAAVVQYLPIKSELLNNAMMENSVVYEQIIQRVKRYNVDIIVFPEAGLTGFEYSQNRTEIRPYLIEIPNPKEQVVIPCLQHDKYNHPILKKLSCAARENEMYVVINLLEIDYCSSINDTTCPIDGAFYYNTNVAFDRRGAVIARYRKINLFCEFGFNYSKPTDLCTFDTDFGVKFGMFICFDIMFSQPSIDTIRQNGVTDVIYSTAWLSEYPLLTAVEIQSAWSYSTNVNLLAANLNNPNLSIGGSGIYGGRLGPLIVYGSMEGGSKILVTEVPKNRSLTNKKTAYLFDKSKNNEKEKLNTRIGTDYYVDPSFRNATKKIVNVTNLSSSSSSILSENDSMVSYDSFAYTNNGLDCKIDISYEIDRNSSATTKNGVHYKFYGYSGVRTFTCTENTIEMCGFSLCSDSDISRQLCLYPDDLIGSTNVTLVSIKIRANSMNVKSIPVPITLNTDLRPIDVSYFRFFSELINVNGTEFYVSQLELFEPINDLLTIAIYKLPFERSARKSLNVLTD